MKVMLVNGSPHKAGSTNRALEEVARTLDAEGIEAGRAAGVPLPSQGAGQQTNFIR